MFKVNNKDTRTTQWQLRCSGVVFIVIFDHISQTNVTPNDT